MKQIVNKNSENQLTQSEPKEVHIRVLIEDDDHGYKELDLISNSEELTKGIKSCRMILDSGEYYLEIVYEELLNRVFRPKIKLDVICNSILNYICCQLNIEELNEKLMEYGNETLKIVAHVNVETDDYSGVSIMPIIEHEGEVGSLFDIFERSINQLSIPSRLEFLTDREKVFLFRVVKSILKSDDSCFRGHFGQLWEFFIEQVDEEEHEFIGKDFLSGVIETLVFYDFISFTYDDNYDGRSDPPIPLKITVFDLDLYDKYFRINTNNLAA